MGALDLFAGDGVRVLDCIFADLPCLVAVMDNARRYVYASPGYDEFLQLDGRDIRGQFAWDVVGREAYQAIQPYVDAAFFGECGITYEKEIVYKGGIEKFVRVSINPIVAENDVAGICAVVLDLTKERARRKRRLRSINADCGMVMAKLEQIVGPV